MISLIIKLLIAHIIGDFVLQPDSWVAAKKIKKHKSKYLYLHGLVHLIVLIILLEFNFSYWPYYILIVLSHMLIDLIKVNSENILNSRLLFVVDQLLHLIVLALVVYMIHPYLFDFVYNQEFLLLLLALLTVTFVSSVVTKMTMSTWNLIEDNSEDSLANAGKYIGILERLFVFGFIIMNQWAAIGFLIAAKSVFRFGDLSRAKDRKLTEYMLIGSLVSFGLAMLIGIIYLKALILL